MRKEDQKLFYKALARNLTSARVRAGISIADLHRKSGEQYATIQSIESGDGCGMYHLLWMIGLGLIDVNQVIEDYIMEGNHGDKKEINKGRVVTADELI